MATYYDHLPTLIERIVGAHLIVVGRVSGMREVRPAEGFHQARVFGLFEIDVDDVLHGDLPDRLLVRVLSDPGGDPDPQGERTRWIVPMDVGVRVLFVLARDIAPGLPDDIYAIYFMSAFPIEDDEWITVPDSALDEATREIVDVDERGRVHVRGLRHLVDAVTTQLDERHRALESLLPASLLEHPYPQVMERPDIEPLRPPPQALPVSSVDGGQPVEEHPARERRRRRP